MVVEVEGGTLCALAIVSLIVVDPGNIAVQLQTYSIQKLIISFSIAVCQKKNHMVASYTSQGFQLRVTGSVQLP